MSMRTQLILPACLWIASFAIRSTDANADEPRYEWVNVTNAAAYAPRDGAGALVFKDKMWLLGGWHPGDKKHFPVT